MMGMCGGVWNFCKSVPWANYVSANFSTSAKFFDFANFDSCIVIFLAMLIVTFLVLGPRRMDISGSRRFEHHQNSTRRHPEREKNREERKKIVAGEGKKRNFGRSGGGEGVRRRGRGGWPGQNGGHQDGQTWIGQSRSLPSNIVRLETLPASRSNVCPDPVSKVACSILVLPPSWTERSGEVGGILGLLCKLLDDGECILPAHNAPDAFIQCSYPPNSYTDQMSPGI